MAYDYKSFQRGDVKNVEPGYNNTIWLAPLSWFEVLQEPVLPAVADGDTLRIKVAHTFKTGKGFIPFYCGPDSVTGDGSFVGIPGAMRTVFTPRFRALGDSPEQLEQLKQWANEDIIAIFKDAKCPESILVQYGCGCSPMNLREGTFTSGNTGDDASSKGWDLGFRSPCKYFYEAAVTEKPVTP